MFIKLIISFKMVFLSAVKPKHRKIPFFGSPFAIYGKYGEPMECTLFWNVKIYVHFICIWCLLYVCLMFYNNNVLQVLSYFVTFFDIFKVSKCINNISNFLHCSSYCFSVSPPFWPDIWIMFISNQHYICLFWLTMDMYNNDYYIAIL